MTGLEDRKKTETKSTLKFSNFKEVFSQLFTTLQQKCNSFRVQRVILSPYIYTGHTFLYLFIYYLVDYSNFPPQISDLCSNWGLITTKGIGFRARQLHFKNIM